MCASVCTSTTQFRSNKTKNWLVFLRCNIFFFHTKKNFLWCAAFFLSFLSSIFLFSFRGWEIWYNYCFFIICHKFLFFGLKWKINKVSLDFIYIINIKIKCSQVLFWPEFRSLIIQKEFQSLLEAKIQQSAVFLVTGLWDIISLFNYVWTTVTRTN